MKIRSTCLSVFLWLWAVVAAQAQTPYLLNITDEDGLPSMTVYDIEQDDKGYIWMGTDRGVCRYDGKQFKYYQNKNQKGNSIDGFKKDKNGQIWCRNFASQIFYVQNDSLHELPIYKDLKPQSFDIDVPQNALWIAAGPQLLVYNISQKTWKSIETSPVPVLNDTLAPFARFITIDKGEVWASPLNAKVKKLLPDNNFQSYPCPNCQRPPLIKDSIVALQPFKGISTMFFLELYHSTEKITCCFTRWKEIALFRCGK